MAAEIRQYESIVAYVQLCADKISEFRINRINIWIPSLGGGFTLPGNNEIVARKAPEDGIGF